MKRYIFLGLMAIVVWNGFLIQRDQRMFEEYDRMYETQLVKSK